MADIILTASAAVVPLDVAAIEDEARQGAVISQIAATGGPWMSPDRPGGRFRPNGRVEPDGAVPVAHHGCVSRNWSARSSATASSLASTPRQRQPLGRPKRVFRRDEAVRLRAEGMSWRKIAARLKVPVTTVVEVASSPKCQRQLRWVGRLLGSRPDMPVIVAGGQQPRPPNATR
jgi:hypothetical protein